jgi:hypothetical protein
MVEFSDKLFYMLLAPQQADALREEEEPKRRFGLRLKLGRA